MAWFVFIIASLIPFYWVRFMIFDIPTNLLEVSVWTLALLKLGLIVVRKEWQRPRRAYDLLRNQGLLLPMILLLLGLLIGLVVTPDKRTALGILKTWFLTPGLALVIALEVIESSRDLWWRLIRGLELAGVIAASFGLFQYLAIRYSLSELCDDKLCLFDIRYFLLPYQRAHLPEFQPYLETGRIFGFTESPNFLAMLLAPAVVLLIVDIASHYQKRRSFWFVLLVLGLLITLFGLFLTRSFGGLFGLLAALLLLGLLWLRYRFGLSPKRLAWLAALSLMLIGAVVIGSREIIPLRSLRFESSYLIRQEIWGTSLAITREHGLFGIGLGNFQDAFRAWTKDRPDFPTAIGELAIQPHSLYLALILNLGLMGLIGFLLLFLQLGRIVASEFDRMPSVVAAGSAALLTQLAHGLVDTTYFKADLSLLFWLLVAILVLTPVLPRMSKVD